MHRAETRVGPRAGYVPRGRTANSPGYTENYGAGWKPLRRVLLPQMERKATTRRATGEWAATQAWQFANREGLVVSS